MLKPEPLNGRSASSDSEIEIVDNELAKAVAAAVARRRAGEPADAELGRIENLSRRRKSLYRRHTSVFA